MNSITPAILGRSPLMRPHEPKQPNRSHPSNRSIERAQIAREMEAAKCGHQALVREAQNRSMTVERDTIFPGAFQVREPHFRGHVQIVTHDTCSCREHRVWGRCPHHALVVETLCVAPIIETRKKGTT